MSRSSLWVMNNEFHGEELVEFNNSWLLSPVAWDILFEKYLPEDLYNEFGDKKSYLSASMFDNTLHQRLNEKINNSSIQVDRTAWELSMQQVFYTKDKEFVAKALKNFLEVNSKFTRDLETHIHERFDEVAEEILKLDKSETPYFIFKNTSVDDNVEYWFEKYDEKEDEYLSSSLNELDKYVTEFVVIKDEKIQGFISNLEFFKDKEETK